MQVWNLLLAARWKYRTQKIAKNTSSGHHRTTLSGCIFATKACIDNRQNLLNSNISSIMSSQCDELRPTNGWDLFTSLEHPNKLTNFNVFLVLPSLLQRHRSPEANQTLHDVWPSPGLVHYIFIFRGSCPWRKFPRCKIHFTSTSCVLLYCQRNCTAVQQRASAKLCGVVQGMELRNFPRGCHLYSAGRPSRWALAHILVLFTGLTGKLCANGINIKPFEFTKGFDINVRGMTFSCAPAFNYDSCVARWRV